MQPQTSWNHTFEPVTNATTVTGRDDGLIDQYQDYYINNNYLDAQYYTPTLKPQVGTYYEQQPAQEYYASCQDQQQQHNTQLYQQQPDVEFVAGDVLSFQLKEIGAVINSEEFNNIAKDNDNSTNIDYNKQEENLNEETEESIYENLKNIVNETAPEPTHADHNNHHSPTESLFRYPDETTMATNTKPYVEIIEQPAKCALRFRYKCEGRSAGSLPGVSSVADNKTFPAIRINNYRGRAVVVISCVTKDAPYRAHPHNIVGKEGCKKGICTIVLNGDHSQDEANKDESSANGVQAKCMTKTFSSLGIQCVKRKDIEDSLTLRESINVDPYRNGFQHKLDTSSIDLNVVRLCFQVFIEGSTPSKCDIPLMPVVSEPVHDKKAMSDLIITKLSHCSAPATGGREVILLCDRITKDDIQIRFFEENHDGEIVWETYSEISPADVHKQVAICFKTPKYYNPNITQPVMARIQLRRISDNQVSEPRLFQFLPCESDEDIISRKRQKIEWVNNHYALDSIFQ